MDERWITVRWDDSVQAVWLEYKAYAEGEEFRAAHEVALSLVRQKRSSRWLSDSRLLAPITQADQRWMNTDFIPRMIAAGGRWVAIVSPKAAVARLSVKQLASKINGINFVTNNFDDIETARRWLLTETTL